MYSYKLNNSYTMYIDYGYINECVAICKKYKKNSKDYSCEKNKEQKKILFLPRFTKLQHNAFGQGVLLSTGKDKVMKVNFEGGIKEFVYPQAIDSGFLTIIEK